MFGIFSSVKSIIYGVLAAIGAGLLLALKITLGQRNRAREERDRAEASVGAVTTQRDKEQAVTQAQSQAREEARDHAEEENNRAAAGKRPSRWGDARLRDD